MATAETPNLALDSSLFVGAPLARLTKRGLEHVVRAQRDETVRLRAPAALQDPHDSRLQVVVANQVEDPAKPLQSRDVALQERLLGL